MRVGAPELTEPARRSMRGLVLFTAYFLLILFVIGIFDLVVGLYELIVTGRFIEPIAIVELLNTVLLLLIIVEVHRTLLAYVRQEPILRTVLGAGIVAIARDIISFRSGSFESGTTALTVAGALSILLITLLIAYLAIWRISPDPVNAD